MLQAGAGSKGVFRGTPVDLPPQLPRPQGLALVSSLGQPWPTEIQCEPRMHATEEILNFLVVGKKETNEKGTGEINFNGIFYAD